MESHLDLMFKQTWALYIDHLMITMIEILRAYVLKGSLKSTDKNYLDLMKASNWDYMMVKCLNPYLEI